MWPIAHSDSRSQPAKHLVLSIPQTVLDVHVPWAHANGRYVNIHLKPSSMKHLGPRTVLLVPVALLGMSAARAQEAQVDVPGDPRAVVESLVTALRTRTTDLNPILVKYRVRRFQAGVFLAEMA
jgi:hypothetical protein